MAKYTRTYQGRMYVTMLSSGSTGAFAWHDMYRMSHPQLKPLANPRDQVHPVSIDVAGKPWNASLQRMVSDPLRAPPPLLLEILGRELILGGYEDSGRLRQGVPDLPGWR